MEISGEKSKLIKWRERERERERERDVSTGKARCHDECLEWGYVSNISNTLERLSQILRQTEFLSRFDKKRYDFKTQFRNIMLKSVLGGVHGVAGLYYLHCC